MKLSELRRKTASAQCSTASIQMSTNMNLMVRSLLDRREWGDNVFTDAERDYLDRLCSQLHRDSQLLLKFSHRLRRAGQ